MVKNITTLMEGSKLNLGEEFLVESLIGEKTVKFLERTKDSLIGACIWKENNKEIIRIGEYLQSSGWKELNMARYHNMAKGDKGYDHLYKILK